MTSGLVADSGLARGSMPQAGPAIPQRAPRLVSHRDFVRLMLSLSCSVHFGIMRETAGTRIPNRPRAFLSSARFRLSQHAAALRPPSLGRAWHMRPANLPRRMAAPLNSSLLGC